ncbi:type II toxin-antitoxin system BrnA family antitoxin [Candidatus Margulisiibacteriota bacterium]
MNFFFGDPFLFLPGLIFLSPSHTITLAFIILSEKIDNNENVDDYLDWSKGKRINETQVRISLDIPRWMIQSLDREAHHLGISRQALIKISVDEHIRNRIRHKKISESIMAEKN